MGTWESEGGSGGGSGTCDDGRKEKQKKERKRERVSDENRKARKHGGGFLLCFVCLFVLFFCVGMVPVDFGPPISWWGINWKFESLMCNCLDTLCLALFACQSSLHLLPSPLMLRSSVFVSLTLSPGWISGCHAFITSCCRKKNSRIQSQVITSCHLRCYKLMAIKEKKS